MTKEKTLKFLKSTFKVLLFKNTVDCENVRNPKQFVDHRDIEPRGETLAVDKVKTSGKEELGNMHRKDILSQNTLGPNHFYPQSIHVSLDVLAFYFSIGQQCNVKFFGIEITIVVV